MLAKTCKDCHQQFNQYSTTQTRCQACSAIRYAPQLRPKRRIKQIGKVTQQWIEYRHEWIKRNMTRSGTWTCYLQISPFCIRTLDIDTITLDHILPKGSNPNLRFEDTNIKPACIFCNGMKGSKKL